MRKVIYVKYFKSEKAMVLFLGKVLLIQLVLSLLGQLWHWPVWLTVILGFIALILLGWPDFRYQINMIQKEANEQTKQILKIIVFAVVGIVLILAVPWFFYLILS